MGGLTISDLVVEYSSGGYAVRPIDVKPRRGAGVAGDLAWAQRLREDDPLVLPRRHPAPEVRLNQV